MKYSPLFITLIITATSCTSNTKPKRFYEQLTGWDIIHIPIIEPYRASSIDGGQTWLINGVINGFGGLDVDSLGVSKNIIYGYSPSKHWFLFDTKSRLLAEYPNRPKLEASLKYLGIPVEAIAACRSYSTGLGANQPCYWFPKDLTNYPNYPPITKQQSIVITVSAVDPSKPEFNINSDTKFNISGIYSYKTQINNYKNDLYYISLNDSPPSLISNDLQALVFIPTDTCRVTVYTPYPVAREKGIPENMRFIKTKTFPLQ